MARKNPLDSFKDAAFDALKHPRDTAEKAVEQAKSTVARGRMVAGHVGKKTMSGAAGRASGLLSRGTRGQGRGARTTGWVGAEQPATGEPRLRPVPDVNEAGHPPTAAEAAATAAPAPEAPAKKAPAKKAPAKKAPAKKAAAKKAAAKKAPAKKAPAKKAPAKKAAAKKTTAKKAAAQETAAKKTAPDQATESPLDQVTDADIAAAEQASPAEVAKAAAKKAPAKKTAKKAAKKAPAAKKATTAAPADEGPGGRLPTKTTAPQAAPAAETAAEPTTEPTTETASEPTAATGAEPGAGESETSRQAAEPGQE
ncbi:MAG: hypothetical protein ACXVW2_11760 [Nocardioidaceae bacterium]